jgi:hypothetical protein
MNIKSIALVTMLAAGIATVNAQIVKGNKYVGGNLGLGVKNENEKDDKFSNDNYNFDLNAAGGNFLTNKLALGVFLKIGASKITNDDTETNSSYNYKLTLNKLAGGIELTKFITIKNKFYFGFKHQLGYSTIISELNSVSIGGNTIYDLTSHSTKNIFGYNFIPELHYFVSEKFSFTAQMGSAGISYGNTKEEKVQKNTLNGAILDTQPTTSKSTEFSSDVRFSLRQFNLGLVYYF